MYDLIATTLKHRRQNASRTNEQTINLQLPSTVLDRTVVAIRLFDIDTISLSITESDTKAMKTHGVAKQHDPIAAPFPAKYTTIRLVFKNKFKTHFFVHKKK